MKRYILVFFLFLFYSGYSQSTINNYKYVIVPVKFSFLKENDQYSLNSLTKGLLQYKGFTVFFDNNELPGEIANNKCNALSADVLDNSGAFTTNLTLVLKDCHGNIVFKSKVGKSREKDYSTSYNMALRDAFTSLDQVSYTYNGSTNEPAQPVVATITAAAPAVIAIAATTSTKTAESNRPASPVVATTTIAAPTIAATTSAKTETNQHVETLYAQAIPNGYQLIDATTKKVLTLLKTSAENYFIASDDTVNGIVLKINEDWFFEYYNDGKLVSKKLPVKI